MISSDIEKKRQNITAEDVKDVGVKIEDKAAEGRRGSELQSDPKPKDAKDGTKNMEGAGQGGAGVVQFSCARALRSSRRPTRTFSSSTFLSRPPGDLFQPPLQFLKSARLRRQMKPLGCA